ncbi:MAG: GIY-YIG domain protein [Parcubacteria group bacterium GW2011_GWB1_43_8]|nr:MAG: GIY-YIG domain protein [Parcubacteria group bacterium GW2011_GWB1_43_8]
MVYVYVIKSLVKNYRYVGITNNFNRRIQSHNLGYNKSTKNFAPYKTIFVENYEDYKKAREREKFLKSGVGRKFLDSLKS